MAKMLVFQVARPAGPLEPVERPIPEPGPGTVRIKIDACGVCHSDWAIVQGAIPGTQFPRVPGHEVIGVIDATGPGVTRWKAGDRVGVGYNGGYDGVCEACQRGEFFACASGQVTGATSDGGYAQYMLAQVSALARIPTELTAVEAAPLMCAGLTTYNGLRRSGARAGDLVAIIGIGGLGHLAVQYAAKMGFRTVAIARGSDKGPLAIELGAHHYIDSDAADVAGALRELGGARIVAATATSAEAMTSTLAGLAVNGKLLVMGVPGDAIQVSPFILFSGRRAIEGVNTGTAIDATDTLAFSLLANVRPISEVFPFKQAPEAYQRMLHGARFRAVLDMTH
ncbi:MAG TPA: alcohol dehydrogenase [Polyangia bacterium]|nr:alcohol dehydrogenase [Polyangia bacterium]